MVKNNKCLVLLMLVAVLVFFTPVDLYASELYDSEPFVYVSSYEVTDGSITPGENFELSITLTNSDKFSAARDLLVNVINGDGMSTVYPSVSQVYIEEIAPNSSVTKTFKYFAPVDLRDSSTVFGINIKYASGRTNDLMISAPINKDSSRFSVLSATVPDSAEAGVSISSSVRFKVQGNDTLSDVKVKVSVDDNIIETSYIGNIRSGATKSQSVSFVIYDPGTHYIVFEIEGTDSNGMTQSVIGYEGSIFVSKEGAKAENQNELVKNPSEIKKQKAIIAGSWLMIIALIGGIVIVVRKNK